MCITPTQLPSGPAACRLCWQCKENRINDYVGRCIAEQTYSTTTLAVNLTYGGGDTNPNAFNLVYDDFQRFNKKLRISGVRKGRTGKLPIGEQYTSRFITAGEYGSKNGRAHWHTVLFFKGKAPEVEIEKEMYTWKPWSHGFSYFQQPDYDGFRYIMKYAIKDIDQQASQSHFGRSLKPPLGHEYFDDLAQRYVEANLAPHSFKYNFPNDFNPKTGKRREYYMTGKSRENFIKKYLELYDQKYGSEHPLSEFIVEQQDKMVIKDEEHERNQFDMYINRFRKSYYNDVNRRDAQFYEARVKGQSLGFIIYRNGEMECFSPNKQGTIDRWHAGQKKFNLELVNVMASAEAIKEQQFVKTYGY